MAYLSEDQNLPVFDRLYRSGTGLTKAEKSMLQCATLPSDAVPEGELKKKNKLASVTRMGEGGPVVVTYPPGRKEQKQDPELTNRGRRRNDRGGFFSS